MDFMTTIKSGRQSFFKPATLVAVFLVLFASAAAVVYLLAPPRPRPVTAPPNLRGTSVARYFESGQWRGDARTLVALVKYLVSPEPTPVTNPPSQTATNQSFVRTG
jgi:hypothetical protein